MDNVTTKNINKKDDRKPMEIIDYGVLFDFSIGVMVAVAAAPFIYTDTNNLIEVGAIFSFDAFKMLAHVVISIWMIYAFFIGGPKKFQKNKSYFLFTDTSIEYKRSGTFAFPENVYHKMPLSEIEHIDYCVMSEMQQSFGRWPKVNSQPLYRKSLIGVPIGKAAIYLSDLIKYVFFVLPYKIYQIKKNGESLKLLNKNLFIYFNNRNYFTINIYSKNDLEEILKYFELHEIFIQEKVHFIPHLQNYGWFANKEEKWSNELNLEGECHQNINENAK